MGTFIPIVLYGLFISSLSYANAIEKTGINELVENIRSQKHNAGLAVAVFNSDEIIHVSTHGVADIESERPVDLESLFMIGSTTKAMTATTAGYLVQEGKLSWDDLVKGRVDNFHLRDEEATSQSTLRDLLLHRTGLPRHDFAWLSRTWTSKQYLELLPLLEPSAEFRAKWQYQNIMYMTAGLVVENAAQSNWADEMEAKIFRNLGMSNTCALASQLHSSDNLALPHNWNGVNLEKIAARNIDGMGPAGSVHSSIFDMVKWGQFNLRRGEVSNGVSLSTEIVAEIHRPQIKTGMNVPFPEFEGEREYGFGWGVAKYRGQILIGHGGGIDGYLTSVYFYPSEDLGVIVLTNGGDLTPDVVMLSVLDYAIGAEPVDWLERMDSLNQQPTLPSDVEYPITYTGALGQFEHPAYGKFTVTEIGTKESKALKLKLNGGYDFTISPWLTENENIWKFEYAPFLFLFRLNDQGIVEQIEANLEPSVPILQFRRAKSSTKVSKRSLMPSSTYSRPISFLSFE